MEKIQKLKLDFTENGSREEFLSAYCGDMNSNVIELEITPELKENEMLICSFMKDNTPVETLVVENKRLVIPYAVLKEEGSYSASFAVADMHSRLTATATLSVTVAKDSILIAPDKEGADDTSLISYILSASAIAARAAVEEDVNGIAEAVSELTEEVDKAKETIASVDGDLTLVASDVELLRTDLTALENEVAELPQNAPTVFPAKNGTCTLTSASGEYACVQGTGSWLRVLDTVVLNFGFYTSAVAEVKVEGLPFSCADAVVSVPVSHTKFFMSPVSVSGDFNCDRAQIDGGNTYFTLYRQSIEPQVVSGTLIYRTNDPMPQ